MCESLGSPLTHHQHLACLDFEQPVLALGQHEAVGLAVHGLRAESGGGEVHLLAWGEREGEKVKIKLI